MRAARLLSALALGLVTMGCNHTSTQAPPPASAAPTMEPAATSAPAASSASAADTAASAPARPSVEAPANATALARGSNDFGFELFGKLRTQQGNLAFSPASIATALTMTWGGAKGQTASQMQKVLHLGTDRADVLKASGQLARSLESPERKVTVRIANRLFGEKSYHFEKAYLETTKQAFGAPLEPVDFKGAAEAARARVNGWVAEQTAKRIENLVPPKGIDDQTRLVLVNAIYFLGDWADPFSKESTSAVAFHVSKTQQHEVPTMHQTGHFRFAAKDGLKALELPYKGDNMSMLLLLPDAVDGLDGLETSLDAKKLDGIVAAMQAQQVYVGLPKFEVNPAESLNLAKLLASMGMPLAFDSSHADFTGIANPPSPADRLYIDKVFHKAFVRVDEKGTEAAAATAVVMPRAGGMPSKPAEFIADHPFLFLIRDAASGLVVFMGRVADPVKS
jgi:serpin B